MESSRQISLFFDAVPEPRPPAEKPVKQQKPVVVTQQVAPVVVAEPILPVKKSTRGRKSIRELEKNAEDIAVPDDETLFSKQYYAMNEVTAMFNVKHSLLRYWENEFDILKPRKNRKGDRHFRPEDIKNIQLIHYLLRQKKYTLHGAKDYLRNKNVAEEKHKAVLALEKVKHFLLEIKAGL